MDKDTLFYRKLNEYYETRDRLYTYKSYRENSYSLVDFLLFFVVASILLILSAIISIIEIDASYLLFMSPFYLLIYLGSLLIIKGRKKQIIKIEKLREELLTIIDEEKPKYNNIKLDLYDYIKELESLGFKSKKYLEKRKTIYILQGLKESIKITSINSFFINRLICEINNINFKKTKNNNQKLKQIIKDYKSESLVQSCYQMINWFCKYIIETIE